MALTLPSKVFFLIFILLMALVFMNLLLGLAVSDIAELERVSCVSDQNLYTPPSWKYHTNKKKNSLLKQVSHKFQDVTMVYFSDPDSHDDFPHDNDDRANEEMLALAARLQVNPSDLQVGPLIRKKGITF